MTKQHKPLKRLATTPRHSTGLKPGVNETERLGNELAKLNAATKHLLAWFCKGARDLPWRHTLDPYAVWISEIMLQQTQVKTVIPYWERWMRELPNLQALAKAKPERVLKLWEGLGYYTRARNLQKAAQMVCEQFGGKFPDILGTVMELPGIGRYTAGAICSIAYNQLTPVLDGNVIRVLSRMFCLEGNVREKEIQRKLWCLAEELVRCARQQKNIGKLPGKMLSAGNCSLLNQALMEMGATVCTARNPECNECPVKKHCAGLAAGRVAELPNAQARPKATERQFLAFVAEHRGRILIQQRPSGVVNAHLWEFPNVEVTGTRLHAGTAAKKLFGIRMAGSADILVRSRMPLDSKADKNVRAPSCVHLCTVKHTITRYRITLEAHRVSFGSKPVYEDNSAKWVLPSELQNYAFPSAHKRLAGALLGM